MKVKSRVTIQEAVRFDGKLSTLEPLFELTTPGSVLSFEQDLDEDAVTIVTVDGDLNAEPGDWVVVNRFGDLFIYADVIFRAQFELADGGVIP